VRINETSIGGPIVLNGSTRLVQDAPGCAPATGCASGDGCCPSTCGPSTDADCNWLPRPETEPNEDGSVAVGTNDFSAANAEGPFSTDSLIIGSISPAGDEDGFAISNPSGSPVTVHLETFGPGGVGTCTGVDTQINVRNVAGVLVDTDDEGGISSCSRLDYLLGAGQIAYVQVIDFGDNALISAYSLVIDFQ
jgi:hypothetical protein